MADLELASEPDPVSEHHQPGSGLLDALFRRHHESLEQFIARELEVLTRKLDVVLHNQALNTVALTRVLELLGPRPHPRSGRLVLLQPTLTDLKTGETLMAAYPLKTNVVAHFVITETDPATGALVPVDPADVFTVVSSDPTNLNAVVDQNAAGQTTVSVNWLHTTTPMLTGVGIALTDSQGNTADNAELFDMVPPAHVAAQIGLDIAGVIETPQPNAV